MTIEQPGADPGMLVHADDARKLPVPQPGPAENFAVRELTHDDVVVWYHVFCTRHYPQTRADTFSEGWGDTRFAPILNIRVGRIWPDYPPINACCVAAFS